MDFMKQLKELFPVLLCACLLAMAACKDSTQKELERMRGEWASKSGNTVFILWDDNGQYKVTRTAKVRGRELTNTYTVRQTDGCLYIDTGFTVVLAYDRKTDRITLSPGGEYQRNSKSLKQ